MGAAGRAFKLGAASVIYSDRVRAPLNGEKELSYMYNHLNMGSTRIFFI
jgi:hypothetical protein